jgi:hypothetical protein
MNWRRVSLLVLLVLLAAAFGVLARLLLPLRAPQAWTVPVSLPAGVRLQVRVSPLLRAATSPWGLRVLDGTNWHMHGGTLALASGDGELLLRCAPCSLRLPALSAQPLQLAALSLALHRDGDRISGWLSAGDAGREQRVLFRGTLSDEMLTLDWSLQRSALSGMVHTLRSVIPEADSASIRGTIAANGTLRFPGANWSAVPHLEGFDVYGLGTERLRYGAFRFVCRDGDGLPHARLVGDGAPGWVPLKQMGRWLPRAVLAAEDARFYSHPGYDLAELVPLLADANRHTHRGASTITQQLAKNFFAGADATGARKLRELLYAAEMERTLGKQRILALYLNTVDWGPGLCGATDAAHAYFGRTPARLSPAEAAWLAGILRNPHRAYAQEFVAQAIDSERLDWVASRIRHYPARRAPVLRFVVPTTKQVKAGA